MTIRRGRRHEFTIDGQIVWLDSLNEQTALTRFVKQYGFSGKWIRPEVGIKHNHKFYTPDFELAVEDGIRTSRAIVEVKEYRRDCVKDTRERMCVIADHYSTKQVFLYAVKKDEWFRLDMRTHALEPCEAPKPGQLNITDLYQPLRFTMQNYYGRRYIQSFSNSLLSAMNPPKPKRRRKPKTNFWGL